MTEPLKAIDCKPPGEGVLNHLKALTEKAERGELSMVASAVVYRDGSTGGSWSKVHDYGSLIGSTAALQHAIIERMRKGD